MLRYRNETVALQHLNLQLVFCVGSLQYGEGGNGTFCIDLMFVFSLHYTFFGFDISVWILVYTLVNCLDNDALDLHEGLVDL